MAHKNVQFLELSDPTFIIRVLATFRLACDNNRSHEKIVVPFHSTIVKNANFTKLDRRMSAATHITPVIATVNNVKPTTHKKRFGSNLEVAGYLLRKFENDEIIAKINFANLCYIKPANMITMQSDDDLYIKSWKVTDD